MRSRVDSASSEARSSDTLSAFSEFDLAWLRDAKTVPCLGPRIAFRDVSRATDSRTLRAALVPAKVFIVHLAPDDKQDKIHELDAVVAHLYGLKQKHLRHIFETFHEGWNHEDRLRATLKHFRAWKTRVR